MCTMQILGVGTPILGNRGGAVMVPLDKALVSSYTLSIVTMSLSEAVWPQLAMQVFGGIVSTLAWGEWGPKEVRNGTVC